MTLEKRYWKLKDEALDRKLRGTCFGRGCGLHDDDDDDLLL